MQTEERSPDLLGLHTFSVFEGDVRWVERDGVLVPDRESVDERTFQNLITTSGKGAYLDRLAGLGGVAAFTALGVGAGTAAPAVGDTQLGGGASVLIKAADPTFPSRAGTVLTIRSTFSTAEANFVWNEAGYFNGTTNGTSIMFNRVAIGPFTKTSAVSIAYTTTISQA